MEFKLRKWTMDDVDSVAQYANNPKIADNLRDVYPYPYTRNDALAYLASCVEQEEIQLTRAIEINGRAAGSIGIFPGTDVYHKNGELGYWLAEPFWGQGIMSGAIRQICGEAFERFGLNRIYAEPYAYNMGSCRALEKAGFTLEGVLRNSVVKHGKIFDSCMYGLLREEFVK